MTLARMFGVAAILALVVTPLDVEAQGRGRGNGNGNGKAKKGNGPPFCRSGAGHPVHGWQWCRDKGWDSANSSIWNTRDRRDDGRIIVWDPDGRTTRDRDRDDDARNRDRDRDDNRRAEPPIRWPF